MKKIILGLSIIAIFFASCNLPQNQDTVKVVADTTGLAEFQMLKARQVNNQYAYAQSNGAYASIAVERRPVYYAASRPVHTQQRTYSRNRNYLNSESSNTAKIVKKKGWSAAAKGTAIGAGGGAIIGAIINKRNPLVGGLIGGILGGAAGYGIGHSTDKANGRY